MCCSVLLHSRRWVTVTGPRTQTLHDPNPQRWCHVSARMKEMATAMAMRWRWEQQTALSLEVGKAIIVGKVRNESV